MQRIPTPKCVISSIIQLIYSLSLKVPTCCKHILFPFKSQNCGCDHKPCCIHAESVVNFITAEKTGTKT